MAVKAGLTTRHIMTVAITTCKIMTIGGSDFLLVVIVGQVVQI